MNKSAHWQSWSCDLHGQLRGGGSLFLGKYSRRQLRDPHKFIVSIKTSKCGEMMIMNDLELPMLSYYLIYYQNFRKVMQ